MGDDDMTDTDLLKGKKILIVDDEPDILEVLEELLDMCELYRAENFEDAKGIFESQALDAAVLDIMGVNGYGLLRIAKKKNIPALMLTAHAFTPDNLKKSIEEGAYSYIPKEELAQIADHLISVLKAAKEGTNPWRAWHEKLPTTFFEKRWGAAWRDADKEFWDTFKASLKSRKKE